MSKNKGVVLKLGLNSGNHQNINIILLNEKCCGLKTKKENWKYQIKDLNEQKSPKYGTSMISKSKIYLSEHNIFSVDELWVSESCSLMYQKHVVMHI